MTQIEFAKIIAYITAGCGKSLSPDSIEVYFDLLGDLSYEVMQIAAKRVMTEHVWATFPSIAELRRAAAETTCGRIKEIQPAEAWEMAWSAAGRIDLDIQGPWISGDKVYASQAACVIEGLPPLVVEAMRSFSLPALIYGTEPVGVIRGQFMKIFEQLAAVDRRHALLPASVKDAIAANKPPLELPPQPVKAIAAVQEERPVRRLVKAWDAEAALANIEKLEPLPAQGENPWKKLAECGEPGRG